MRSRYRTVLVALLAVFAVGAVASASASASTYEVRVEGKAIPTKGEVFIGTIKVAELIWQIQGAEPVTFECTRGSGEGWIGPAGKSEWDWEFSDSGGEHCKATKVLKHCYMNKVTIRQSPGLLSSSDGKLEYKFEPPVGTTTFFEFYVGGEGCAIYGRGAVSGTYSCGLPGVETEAVEHEVVCKPEGSDLTTGPVGKFSFEYTEKVKLLSGKKWSIKTVG